MRLIVVFFIVLLNSGLYASELNDDKLKKEIGHMLLVGFDDEYLSKESKIVRHIQDYELGGVILFDRFYTDRARVKNIRDSKQLKRLTKELKLYAKKPLLISIDQEGGKVARLKPAYGFETIPSAQDISTKSLQEAKAVYQRQARMLREHGLNCDFAPVVDLAVNPENKVIVRLERSYGSSSEDVTKYAGIFMDSLKRDGVKSVLKHFPGHGSSLGDSHKGFVDITHTWSKKELEPYKKLIDEDKVQMIMSAHVFNKKLDEKYPATLSYNVNTKLLREEMGYDGVLISDDMQMKAISQHYSLKEAVTLAINSGVDILLFGNQLATQDIDELVDVIYNQVKSGKIKYERIKESNKRIEALHNRYKIIQRPINFGEKRTEMTKGYIKQHYGLDVEDITIKPKSIVLHWTAIMDFDECYERLEPEELYTDRMDIASAGALNVSSHFLVDRDGTIYQLMPDNLMARHVIGLNYTSIGIENVGGECNIKEDLTPQQVEANIFLVNYLKNKYPDIEYLIGHHEYRKMENSPLWLEKDAGYRTKKADPGDKFMSSVREAVKELGLKKP